MNSPGLLKAIRNKRGVTLLELLLVVAIMSTMSVMTVAFYSRFFNQNAVDNTVDQLVGSFRKAQQYAMMGKQGSNCIGPPCNWGVNYLSNTITLYLGNSFANRTQAFDEKFTVNSSINLGAFSDINFTHATGLPAGAQALTITGPNNISKNLTVNAQGVVTR